jgi:hypothetical protein
MTFFELPQREKGSACAEPIMSLVGRTGFEPVTNGLKVLTVLQGVFGLYLKSRT